LFFLGEKLKLPLSILPIGRDGGVNAVTPKFRPTRDSDAFGTLELMGNERPSFFRTPEINNQVIALGCPISFFGNDLEKGGYHNLLEKNNTLFWC